jgi:hypothetical protein
LADFPAAAAFQESALAFRDRLGAGCWRGQAPDLGQIAVGCLQSPPLDSGAPPTRGAARRTLQDRRESRRTAAVPAARPSTNKDLDGVHGTHPRALRDLRCLAALSQRALTTWAREQMGRPFRVRARQNTHRDDTCGLEAVCVRVGCASASNAFCERSYARSPRRALSEQQ